MCSALPKEEDSTSSVFFEIVKTPVITLVVLRNQTKQKVVHLTEKNLSL